MREAIFILFAILAMAFPAIAENSSGDSSAARVGLEIHRKDNVASSNPHRALMLVNVQAYYSNDTHTLRIRYEGDDIGETFLYLNGELIGFNADIESVFEIHSHGFYRIEIISETWIAEGNIQL